MQMETGKFTHIIVGGGTAGCVLAARLSEIANNKVLLLEAGGADWHPYIHMPVGFAKLTDSKLTWGYSTARQANAGRRRIPYAQGKVIGGGSSVNAEVYTRGTRADFDRWAYQEGCTGWDFDSVFPYFLRSEGNTAYADDFHATDGPLGVSNAVNPLKVSRAFVMACQQLGIPYNHDFNGAKQEGAGYYQVNVVEGRRCSAAKGYLSPAKKRKNLKILTYAQTEKLIVKGKRIVGVQYRRHGQTVEATASAEVLLTSGAIGTPKLLMQSGIGPAAHLKEHGIEILADIPDVGENLSDHVNIDVVAELHDHLSLDKYKKAHWAIWAGLQYGLFGTGPVASNVVEAGLFWHVGNSGADEPNIQFHFLAGAGAEAGVSGVEPGKSGITLNCYGLRPRSKGTVKLSSSDPYSAPIIDPNFFQAEEDLELTVEGLKLGRKILEQPALDKLIKRVVLPDPAIESTHDLINFVCNHARTSYHPTGTCRMGTDEGAVVDTDLCLIGFEGIRICDASIFPSIVSANTNATTAMVAEKAADLIMKK